ncbi:MAG: hypothetical protein LCH56_08160 [Proteobacteria bacterium]|nr:hypothetical protein [Pseudomonadota bacterium]
MPFVRILLLIVAALAIGVIGLAFFRPDPEIPVPQAESAPPVSRPVPAAPPRAPDAIMSPVEASSPAEITAREAAEAQRRLEQEQREMTPDSAPVEMMPPGDPPPVK